MVRILLFWKTILWSSLMLAVFLMPAKQLSNVSGFTGISEMAHILLFTVFTWLLVSDQAGAGILNPFNKQDGRPSARNYLIAGLCGLLFGILIEILQEISNLGRTAEMVDVLFDIAGILLSIILLTIIFRPRH